MIALGLWAAGLARKPRRGNQMQTSEMEEIEVLSAEQTEEVSGGVGRIRTF